MHERWEGAPPLAPHTTPGTVTNDAHADEGGAAAVGVGGDAGHALHRVPGLDEVASRPPSAAQK